MITKNCKQCNKEFGKPYYRSKKVWEKTKFCSHKCWCNSRKKYITKKCKQCDKEFETWYSTSITRVFCSRICKNRWQSIFYIGEKSNFWKGGSIKKKCKNCEKEFNIWPYRVKKNQGLFCSEKCFGEATSREKSCNWLGGKSFEPYGLEFNDKLKEQIRKRDNYTCQKCRKTQDELRYSLAIHHINYIKTDNNPLNLIGLCSHCHGQTSHNQEDWTNYFKNKINATKNNKPTRSSVEGFSCSSR